MSNRAREHAPFSYRVRSVWLESAYFCPFVITDRDGAPYRYVSSERLVKEMCDELNLEAAMEVMTGSDQ